MSNIRPEYKIRLAVDSDLVYESIDKGSRYIIIDSVIQIFPGEKLFIEADIVRDNLTNFKVVKQSKDSSKTLTLEFLQELNGKAHKQMVLIIDNPFNKEIEYSAIPISIIGRTNSMSKEFRVLAKSKSIQTWPDILTSLILKSFKLR